MSETEVTIPVIMSLDFYNKITYLSNEFNKEIAGWITGKVQEDGIYLDDLLIPKQEVSSASVDIATSAGAALVKEFKEKCQKIIGHWHSHVGMGCFWSSVDEENMRQIMDPRKFFVFSVSSKGKHMIRVETKEPFRISVDKLDYKIEDLRYEKVKEKMEKEIEKKVTEPEVTTNSNYGDNTDLNTFGVRTSNVTVYSNQALKPKNISDLKESGDGEDFSLEIVDNVIAEFRDKRLKIMGLDSCVAPVLMEQLSEFKPELDDFGYDNQQISFKLKRKKARKILPMIQDLINDYEDNTESFNNFPSYSAYGDY